MRLVFILLMLIGVSVYAQNEALATEYFKNGDFEKALYEYKRLYAQSPSNINYIYQVIATYQQLEQYDEAEEFLLNLMARINYPAFMVELGYNYQLKNNSEQANTYYQQALKSIDDKPSNVFSVAKTFQNHSLLDETIVAYEKAMLLNPDYNFNLQLAKLFGEQGNIEKMFTRYVEFAELNPIALSTIKRSINEFISENGDNVNNQLLKKILLKKLQVEPKLLWNELLSWLFIQQKDFNKAFIQEKAIYRRQPESLNRIEELALIALNEGEDDMAKSIFQFLIETSQELDVLLHAHFYLLDIETKNSSKDAYEVIDSKYQNLFVEFGKNPQTLKLQIAYAHFLAFYRNDSKKATSFLEDTLNLSLSSLQKAEVKLELGDILVLQERFSQALIYYTQIQRNLKNSTISQEARFKVARASYYKGDFKWAESQLKILKSSTSQLIANDALDLKLLITDNKYGDSLQTALKLYAKADLLEFQNKKEEALRLLDTIIDYHKTELIIPQALFKQAKLFVEKSEFNKAVTNYEAIIENYPDGILADDAYFFLAEIYERELDQPDLAKPLYEQIIFSYADSIFFVEARKRYRALRGDSIN
ncbi:tetratricopeptide repeat protein [Gaetbulibacter saemankumensis]|uniref:tetratricopeptide repeat protein n=1 Tax=Gaetbulibacter saemankumensis TaxID=311208 RepID=UPI000484B787|nr:tetratricopeptide repeat protein [Gaetbulibacter saemankumensis]